VTRSRFIDAWFFLGYYAEQSNREAMAQRKAPAKPTSATRPGRGLVDAPGKRHRKLPHQERLDKQLGEPRGKQSGQKQFKIGKRSGRG